MGGTNLGNNGSLGARQRVPFQSVYGDDQEQQRRAVSDMTQRHPGGHTGLAERRVKLRIVFGKHVSIFIQHPVVPRSAFGFVKSRAAPAPFATQLSSSLDLCWIGLEHHH